MTRPKMSGAQGKRYPGEVDETYPDLFTTIPPQPTRQKPGQLSRQQLQQFFQKGWVVVDDYFSQGELEPCKKDLEKLVDDLAKKLYNAGKIKNAYSGYGFTQRMAKIENEFPGANVLFIKGYILPKSFQEVWSCDRLLNAMEQLIGPDIAGNPIYNIRVKTPQNDNTTVPWHQDNGYTDNDSYNSLVVTAWIPFVDTDETNGCLQLVSGGHGKGKVAKHTCCWKDTWYVDLDGKEMEKSLGVDLSRDVVTVPVKYGSMLLFNNMLPHRSLNNTSDGIRWSMDIRWQSSHKPYGFYGLKDGLVFRDSKNPNHKIDWDSFFNIARNEEIDAAAGKVADEFDTVVPGPWMGKWEITNRNRHTDSFTSAYQQLHLKSGTQAY